MVIRILAMEEGETLVNDIGKFVKKSEFHQINIPTKHRDMLIDHKNIEFLNSENVLEQINKINEIKTKWWNGNIKVKIADKSKNENRK